MRQSSKFTLNGVDNGCNILMQLMFLSSVNNNFFVTVWAMKFTETTNVWYISVRVTCTIKLNIKKPFMGDQDFVQMFMW